MPFLLLFLSVSQNIQPEINPDRWINQHETNKYSKCKFYHDAKNMIQTTNDATMIRKFRMKNPVSPKMFFTFSSNDPSRSERKVTFSQNDLLLSLLNMDRLNSGLNQNLIQEECRNKNPSSFKVRNTELSIRGSYWKDIQVPPTPRKKKNNKTFCHPCIIWLMYFLARSTSGPL